MKTKYVVLRKLAEGRPTRTMRSAGFEAAAAIPKVEVHDRDPRVGASESERASVECAAPVMPMRLIEPVATNAEVAAAAGPAWGIKAVGADESPFDGSGIVVAVLDTGIDPNHPAFTGVDLGTRKNFTQEGDDDQHGHGTHCAGTFFGRDVNGTRIGVARGVKKAVIGKVLGKGGGSSDKVAEAVEWAIGQGAQVISMSLGIDFPGYVKALEEDGYPTELATSIALEGFRMNILLFQSLASYVSAKGGFGRSALLVAAAGNESRMDEKPDFEIAVSPPAVADGFVSVAALAQGAGGFTMAPFSNVGARVAGPGVDVISAKRGSGLVGMSGTSMATPHVAGVAALWAQKLLAASGRLSGQMLFDRLVGSGTTTGMKPGFAPSHVGNGLVQAPQN